MFNNNQTQTNQVITPLPNTSSSRDRLPVLEPVDDPEGFDKILAIHMIDGHWYILAATKSGKTHFIKLACIRLIQNDDSSIVLFDPHGDLARQCARLFEFSKRIIYIDPTLKEGFTPTINPFRLKNIDELTISIVAQELIVALESIIGVDFSPNMEALITPLIYTLLRKGDSGIDELLRFMDDSANEDLIAIALQSPIKAHVDFMKNQFSQSKFTRTKEALATKLQILLNNPIFSNFITGDSTFDLEKALNNKKIIIFRLPKGKMRKTLEPAAKLIMALIQGIVFKRSDLPKNLRPKTHLICDEYQNFFSQISEEMLSESAKNHLFIIGAHQYLSQLDVKSRDALMSAASIKIVGRNSDKDLKAMGEEIEVDLQSLKRLKQGQFYIKCGSAIATKAATTDRFLDDNDSVDEQMWKQILKFQKKRYYKKIVSHDIVMEVQSDTVTEDSTTNKSLPIPSFDD